MSTYEMPVVVRFSKEEFAVALDRPVSDPDVERIGGMNVVLQPIAQSPKFDENSAVANALGASAALRGLQEALQPIEEELFQRLRSNPDLARRFVLDPAATLEELGLLNASLKSQVASYAQTLAPLFAVNR